MAVVTLEEVQQFLEPTKLTLATFDAELEATAREIVFSRVAAFYDTSTWLTEATTPDMIRKIIGMWIAGITYQRQYSEDMSIEDGNWGVKLETMALALLDGVVAGSVDLGVDAVVNTLSGPVFWPNDTSIDSDGCPVAPAFSMGQEF